MEQGATIFANIWAMAHDEEVYPNPFQFRPERFLGAEPQMDPKKFVFGFGRRVCPGTSLLTLSNQYCQAKDDSQVHSSPKSLF